MQVKTLILGAGAAGMMCAAHAGGDTLVVDHAKRVGQKIIMSGGGRCNFTNLFAEPENFLCSNRHFVKSALKRYTQWDFIDLVDRFLTSLFYAKPLEHFISSYKVLPKNL